MININNIELGTTITKTTEFTVIKKNKKSVVIKDSKGETTVVRDRDYSKYGMSTQTEQAPVAKKTTSKTTSTKSPKSLPSLRGRYPKWANSNPKKEFVRSARAAGNPTTETAYAEYKTFLKTNK